MTTMHAVTGDQRVVDLPHKDLRRARAAGANIVPTSTGAAKAIGLVVPELAGKLHGLRGPRAGAHRLAGRSDRRARAGDDGRRDQRRVRDRRPATASPASWDLDEPLVSSDVIKSPYSSVVDAELTTVTGGTQAKVIAWYDNEWGYSTRLVELAQQRAPSRLIRETGLPRCRP